MAQLLKGNVNKIVFKIQTFTSAECSISLYLCKWGLNYTSRILHMLLTLLCFVLDWYETILSLFSGSLHWHWGNQMIVFRLTSQALGQSNDCFQAYFTGTGAIKGLFSGLLHRHWGNQMIVFRLISLALGQSNDCFQAYFTCTGGNQMIVFRLTSLALGQSNDCFQAYFTGTGAIKWLFSGLLHWHWGNQMIVFSLTSLAHWHWGNQMIVFSLTSLALGQSNECFQAYFTGTGAIKWLFSGLLHWHWGNQMIAPVPAKWPWRILLENPQNYIMLSQIAKTIRSTSIRHQSLTKVWYWCLLEVYTRVFSRRHRAAHVESQIVPLFPQSLTIRVVGSVLNDARRRYEKCIVLGQ